MANFSKLIIDPSVPIINNDLIPQTYKSDPTLPISFNAQGYQYYERLSGYYLEYHKVLQDLMWFLEPEIVVGVHSHLPTEKNDFSDVILRGSNGIELDCLAAFISEKLKLKVKVATNLPAHGCCNPYIID